MKKDCPQSNPDKINNSVYSLLRSNANHDDSGKEENKSLQSDYVHTPPSKERDNADNDDPIERLKKFCSDNFYPAPLYKEIQNVDTSAIHLSCKAVCFIDKNMEISYCSSLVNIDHEPDSNSWRVEPDKYKRLHMAKIVVAINTLKKIRTQWDIRHGFIGNNTNPEGKNSPSSSAPQMLMNNNEDSKRQAQLSNAELFKVLHDICDSSDSPVLSLHAFSNRLNHMFREPIYTFSRREVVVRQQGNNDNKTNIDYDGVLDTEPDFLLCPITQEVMDDPVITCDGHTFERKAIEDWLNRNDTNPMTGAKMQSKILTSNYALRDACASFKAKDKKLADIRRQYKNDLVNNTAGMGAVTYKHILSCNCVLYDVDGNTVCGFTEELEEADEDKEWILRNVNRVNSFNQISPIEDKLKKTISSRILFCLNDFFQE